MTWLSELRVTVVLFLLAAVIPLLWAYADSRRRLELKQTALVACFLHRNMRDCAHLRTAPYHAQAWEYCLLRYTHSECAEFKHGRSP